MMNDDDILERISEEMLWEGYLSRVGGALGCKRLDTCGSWGQREVSGLSTSFPEFSECVTKPSSC